MSLLFGRDAEVSAWAALKLNSNFLGFTIGIGLVENGELVGAAILHNWSHNDIELSIVGRMSKQLLIAAAWIAFSRVGRITVRVPRRKKRILKAAVKYGFRLEGTIRRLYGPFKRDDGIVFGLLKEEASRFIKGLENVSTKSA
ncbi:MAG: GNAT family N-acetyltransferase [Bdellovibrionaceae bacterium]|nr:GNAT family N-acetyltransferase [Pseudobdellovibrionaceae bacterium]